MKLECTGNNVIITRDTTDPEQGRAHSLSREQFAKHARDPEFAPGIGADTLERIANGETFSVTVGEPEALDAGDEGGES